MTNDWCNSINDDILEEEWEHTQTCYTENQTSYGETLVPRRVGQCLIMRICHLLEEDFSYDHDSEGS